jgi:TIR domain
MATPRIFVSHSHQDNEWCSQLVDALTLAGFDVWFDKQGLYVGDQWIGTLEAEIEGRDVFLIVLTPDSWSSPWVRREYELALRLNKRILGVMHKPTKLTGFITTLQILDAVGWNAQRAAQQISMARGFTPRVVPTSGDSPARGPRTNGVYVGVGRLLKESSCHILRFYVDGHGASVTIPVRGRPPEVAAAESPVHSPQMWSAQNSAPFTFTVSDYRLTFTLGTAQYSGNLAYRRDTLELDVEDWDLSMEGHQRYVFLPVVFAAYHTRGLTRGSSTQRADFF